MNLVQELNSLFRFNDVIKIVNEKHIIDTGYLYDLAITTGNGNTKEVNNMFKMKQVVAVGLAVLTVSAFSVTALAVSNYGSPAEAIAGISDRELESVIDERHDTGKTYGEIANDAGVLDEFKAAVLEMKKDYLDSQVAEGNMTQEEAAAILAAIEENQATCEGTGGAKAGQLSGAGFGTNGGGLGNSNGFKGQGGNGQGTCSGLRTQDGTCE